MTYAMRTSAARRLAEDHPRRRVRVGGPLERADEDARETAEAEAAEAVEPPLPREPTHDPLEVADAEARELELRDQLLAAPELVVDVVSRAPFAVRSGDQPVLCVEHEVPARTQHALDLGVEAPPRLGLEAAHEAEAEDEVELAAREGQREAVAAHEVPGEAALAGPAARLGEHAWAEVHADRDGHLAELRAQARGSGCELEHAGRRELCDDAVQVRDLPVVQHGAERLRLAPPEVGLDDARVVVELREARLRPDRLGGTHDLAASRVPATRSRSASTPSAGAPSRTWSQ